jgi:hypothetical protein
MIRIFAFILFSQQILLNAYPQNLNDKGYVSLSIGPSIPVGNYARTNLSNDQAVFAALGGSAILSYSRLIGKKIGLAAELLGQINPLNVKALEKDFGQQKFALPSVILSNGPPQNLPHQVYVSYQNWGFDKKSWFSGSALVGGYGEFALSKAGNISVTTKVLLGAAYLSAPKLSGESHTDTSWIKVGQTAASAFGFAYSLSSGLKYDFNKKISLIAIIEYFGTSNVTFKNVTESLYSAYGEPNQFTLGGGIANVSAQTSNTANTSQKVSILNISLGIGLRL